MRRRRVLALSGASLAGCVGRDADATETTGGGGDATETSRTPMTDGGTERTEESGGDDLTLSSPEFEEGGTLPTRFTCSGAGVSPPLSIAGVPDGAAALAVVADDPDAPGSDPFVHWLLWNLPPDTESIPADVKGERGVLDGARQGTNGGGEVGYYPACPPRGDGPHTYRFTLYALSKTLDADGGARCPAVQEAIDAATVAQTRLTATFERSG